MALKTKNKKNDKFPFKVDLFEKENKALIRKYIRKNTNNLRVPDFENISPDWYYNGNENILRGNLNLEKEYTVLQKLEWIKCRDNIIYFIEKYVQIISIDEGLVPFKMYDYQKELVELFNNHRHVIACQARQSGKCSGFNTKIKIRNKYTHETKEINIGDFHELTKKKAECI